jgi:type IV pilus assembly protein PilM
MKTRKMSAILNAAKLGLQTGGRPPEAVELSAEGVLAAALPGAGEMLAYGFAALPAGALVPGIGEPNLRAPEVVADAIREAMGRIAARKRAVTVLLPDNAVRVFVLDFDTLPAKTQEALAVLRFRLRKIVPFDVEHAGVSYQMLPQDKTECRVLTAVTPGPILAEYEAAVRAAGYEPGAVLPAGLAALATLELEQAVLTASLSATALTTCVVSGEDLLLYRTLDLPEDEDHRAVEIQRGIAVAAAYFEDKLGGRPKRLHYTGNRRASEFARWVDDQELEILEMAAGAVGSDPRSSSTVSRAGVAGALAGAR